MQFNMNGKHAVKLDIKLYTGYTMNGAYSLICDYYASDTMSAC